MTKKIITTVGTSILTNYDAKDEREYKTLDEKPFFQGDNSQFDIEGNKDFSTLKTFVNNNSNGDEPEEISAEIKSILKIVEETQEDAEVYLLATDTVLSVLACELVRDWFNPIINQETKERKKYEHKFKVKDEQENETEAEVQKTITVHFEHTDKFICAGLRVAGKGSAKDFQEKGFFSLIENIKHHKPDILCFSGGYKSIIPFMTLIGQIENLPLYCIYEAPDSELVKVGNLPFSFDWTFGEMYFDFLTKEGLRTLNTIPDELLIELKENGLIKTVKNKYKLTVLGQMFRDYMQPLLSDKKSAFGYFMELILFKTLHEQQSDNLVRQGKKIWWYIDTNTYGDSPKFDKNDKQERSIDIDILIQENGEEIWCEVKPFTRNKINEAKKQVKVMLDFQEKAYYPNLKEIRILFYKLPKISLSTYKDNLEEIEKMFEDKNIEINFYYYELPLNQKGLPNTKGIFDSEITLHKIDLNQL